MMGFLGVMACVVCDWTGATDAPWFACPSCAAVGRHSNVLATYSPADADSVTADDAQPGIFRYRARLPIDLDAAPVSLQEGDTPLIGSEILAEQLGVRSLWIKDETRNPTWSYKDRLAAVAITEAKARGADTVALATTGNHGAAAAAYAAAAGLRCIALTLSSVPATMKVLMASYGAEVVALESPPDRWRLLRQGVEERGWVPVSGFLDPPIGSNAYGVDGYKSIAFETVEQLQGPPHVVLVPAAYADGLVGIHRGFRDLHEAGAIDDAPRMVAVDPFGAYEAGLASPSPELPRVPAGSTVSFSIGTPIATHQGLAALRESGGMAVAVGDDEEVMRMQRRIAAATGLFLEASSVTTFVAVEKLASEGRVGPDDDVVCIATSTGLKDVDSAELRLPPVVTVPPDLDALEQAIGNHRRGEAPGQGSGA
jgi:threonine synthase